MRTGIISRSFSIINGFNRADFNTYIKAIPDFIVKEELSSSEDYEEAKKGFMEEIDDFKEEFGQNYKLSYKVLDKTPIDVDKLKDLEEDISEAYHKKVRVTEGYKVKIMASVSGEKKKEEKERTYRVYKIDGKWYLTTL